MSTTTTRIGPADHGRRMTPEEFREADGEPGYRYELARGVLHVVEVPGRRHWRVVDNLHEALSDHRRRVPRSIDLIGHGSDVRFRSPTLDSDRHPDLGVALVGDPVDELQRPIPGLVIEVVCPGKSARGRDYAEKAEDYLAIGVREYWIVDPELRQVTVLLRGDGPAWEEAVASGDRPIPSGVLPGFTGTVAQLWEGTE